MSVQVPSDPAVVLDPDSPFRILLLGDFGGRAAQGVKSSTGWNPVEIDRDNFRRSAGPRGPRVFRHAVSGNWTIFIRTGFTRKTNCSNLCARCAGNWRSPRLFAKPQPRSADGRANRPRLPRQGGRSRRWNRNARALPDPASGVSLLDFMVEADEPKAPSQVLRRGDLRSFVESVVAPHTVPAEDPELPKLREMVDAEASERMRAMLHHSTFQALEAAWRGLFHLVRAVETGSELRLYLLDISKTELAADLNSADDLRQSRVWRLLVGETVESGEDPWSVVAGNYSFTRTMADAEMLGRLAKIMSFAGAPFLGEADPGNSGTETEEEGRNWERLRRLPEACWIGLAMPRFLLRLPYGKKRTRWRAWILKRCPARQAIKSIYGATRRSLEFNC